MTEDRPLVLDLLDVAAEGEARASASSAAEDHEESASDEVVAPSGTVKVSVLARMSGVPSATIKHYVREGLLPEPSRTSRNMAYYDVALVPRIEKIKELQRTRFLPLKVIKQILDESELETEDETVGATIARVLEQTAPAEQRTKAELLASGMPPEQLELLAAGGIISEVPGEPEPVYAGDDLELLRVLGNARRAGITPEMLPVTILGDYARTLRALVEVELRLFREGVMPQARGRDLPSLTEAATTLSERLVMLLRRKMLLPTLRAVADQARRTRAQPAPSPAERTETRSTERRRRRPERRS